MLSSEAIRYPCDASASPYGTFLLLGCRLQLHFRYILQERNMPTTDFSVHRSHVGGVLFADHGEEAAAV